MQGQLLDLKNIPSTTTAWANTIMGKCKIPFSDNKLGSKSAGGKNEFITAVTIMGQSSVGVRVVKGDSVYAEYSTAFFMGRNIGSVDSCFHASTVRMKNT